MRDVTKAASSQSTQKKEKKCYSAPARQQNTNIVLGKLQMNPEDIAEALVNYSPEILTPSVCELLYPICPTEKEFEEISKATEAIEDVDDFDKCDLFIVLIGSVIGSSERLLSIMFKNAYRKDSIEILKLIDVFFKGFDFVLTNEHLQKLFEIMLAHGNYMNGITNKGGAFGFKLDSLPKILEMKSKDNRRTLIQYIVTFIIEDLKDHQILDILKFLQLFEKSKFIIYIHI